MKGSESESEKMRKMALKNQQRCLNSLSFNQKRAYLTRQKCHQRIFYIEDNHSKGCQQSASVDEHEQKGTNQNVNNLQLGSGKFDRNSVLKQVDHVNVVIKEIEAKNLVSASDLIKKKRSAKLVDRSGKASLHFDKLVNTFDFRRNSAFLKPDQMNGCKKNSSVLRPRSTQSAIQGSRTWAGRMGEGNMTKIKSKKHMMRVYNPFPIPMAEMLQMV